MFPQWEAEESYFSKKIAKWFLDLSNQQWALEWSHFSKKCSGTLIPIIPTMITMKNEEIFFLPKQQLVPEHSDDPLSFVPLRGAT
jgi:hypothetical protein